MKNERTDRATKNYFRKVGLNGSKNASVVYNLQVRLLTEKGRKTEKRICRIMREMYLEGVRELDFN